MTNIDQIPALVKSKPKLKIVASKPMLPTVGHVFPGLSEEGVLGVDLAAKSCPRHVEATFFALLASVYNVGTQASQNVGGRLYDHLGYLPLVLISTGMTAATWLLVPLVKIDRIEARAKHAEVPAT